MKKSLVVALLHLCIVLSIGGKLLLDRATRPRVWTRVYSFDPSLVIRGRYAALTVRVHAPWLTSGEKYQTDWVTLSGENHELVAAKSRVDTGVALSQWNNLGLPTGYANLSQPILFFLPEHANDPSRVKPGEELWAEVTLPRKGPPRPIQLAVKDAQGGWHPVGIR